MRNTWSQTAVWGFVAIERREGQPEEASGENVWREEDLDQRGVERETMDEVKRQKAEVPGRCGPGAMLM